MHIHIWLTKNCWRSFQLTWVRCRRWCLLSVVSHVVPKHYEASWHMTFDLLTSHLNFLWRDDHDGHCTMHNVALLLGGRTAWLPVSIHAQHDQNVTYISFYPKNTLHNNRKVEKVSVAMHCNLRPPDVAQVVLGFDHEAHNASACHILTQWSNAPLSYWWYR